MHQECIMTIDLGTTACKVVLFRANGEMMGHVSIDFPTWRPDARQAEQYPEDWWKAASRGVRKVLANGQAPVHVVAISLSSQRETVMPMDEKMMPLHPALLWMDMRGIDSILKWGEVYGEDLQKWTGLNPSASYTAGKLKWLQQMEPNVFKRAAHFLQPKDYMLHRMSGERSTDYSLASRTMLFNIRERKWQEELLEDCRIKPEQLPPVHASTEIIGRLRQDVADDWGLSPGIPIVLGGGDRACEVLGSGIQAGEIMESTGTTSNIACSVSQIPDPIPSRILCSLHVVEGQYILEQGLSTTGAIVDWWRGVVESGRTYEDLEYEMRRSKPGADGLLVMPFFMGARAPRWNPYAQGAILGLTLSHQGADITRAMLEGIGYELRYAIQSFEELELPVNRIHLIGGGTRICSWSQTKANIYQKRLAIPKVAHAASFGAFLLAARQMNWISSYEEGQKMNPLQSIYHPQLQYSELYNAGYELYLSLNDRLQDMWQSFHRYRDLNSNKPRG